MKPPAGHEPHPPARVAVVIEPSASDFRPPARDKRNRAEILAPRGPSPPNWVGERLHRRVRSATSARSSTSAPARRDLLHGSPVSAGGLSLHEAGRIAEAANFCEPASITRGVSADASGRWQFHPFAPRDRETAPKAEEP